ncbi:MAG: hypothetical protein KGM44_05805 [bacterium]|nr:hypothetical protein [bacterium]
MIVWHTSDIHDHGGFGERLRALTTREPGLLLDCGDSLRGSQTVYHRREPIIAEIDAAGYRAQAMGNREFHYLFGGVRARAAQMRHPLLCSNLLDTRGRALPFARDLWIEAPGGGLAHLFALLVCQYRTHSFYERLFGWRFLDPYAVAQEFAAAAPPREFAGRPFAVIALSHLGLRADRELARRLPELDLILGGHSHDTLPQPEWVGDVPIVHAGPYAGYVSRTQLDLSGARPRVAHSELLPLLAQRAARRSGPTPACERAV